MTSQPGQSWHIAFADIALILFLLTATALARQEDLARQGIPASGTASAIFDASKRDEDFVGWLSENVTDSRQTVTITLHHSGSLSASQFHEAAALANKAAAHNIPYRIVIERADKDRLLAVLAFDGSPQMARSLLNNQEEPANGDF